MTKHNSMVEVEDQLYLEFKCDKIMVKYWIGRIIIALCVSSFCSSEDLNPTAKFLNVTVEGVLLKTRKGRDVDAFMGIPYAEPPVGDLRFRNPKPKVYYAGTLVANKTGINCVQDMGGVFGDEDCLYLNIYRPSSRSKRLLPVMAYIYGGGFVRSNADVSGVGPGYLLDRDIILITMNYRMGVFGFLSTGDEAATGNFGLKDQKLALEWIRTHIVDFGGNSNQITLFGGSSGSTCVHIHALVNHTKGLFHRYILQSGTALAPFAIRDPKTCTEWTKNLATVSECPTRSTFKLIDCLRKIDSRRLQLFSETQFDFNQYVLVRMWGPTKEPDVPDAYLTEYPQDLIAGNKQRDLPFIAGVTARESLSPFIIILFRNQTTYDELSNDISQFLNNTLGSSDWVERVIQFYFNGSIHGNDNNTMLERLERFASDYNFFYPQVKMLEERRRNSRNSFYFYDLEYRGTFSFTSWDLKDNRNVGASHADDKLYLFQQNRSMFPVEGNLSMDNDDYQIVDTIVDLWTSFATQGVPRSRYVDSWKPYDSRGDYLQIGKRNKDPRTFMKSKFHVERMKFWNNLYRRPVSQVGSTATTSWAQSISICLSIFPFFVAISMICRYFIPIQL